MVGHETPLPHPLVVCTTQNYHFFTSPLRSKERKNSYNEIKTIPVNQKRNSKRHLRPKEEVEERFTDSSARGKQIINILKNGKRTENSSRATEVNTKKPRLNSIEEEDKEIDVNRILRRYSPSRRRHLRDQLSAQNGPNSAR